MKPKLSWSLNGLTLSKETLRRVVGGDTHGQVPSPADPTRLPTQTTTFSDSGCVSVQCTVTGNE
jgi:hypothetical protein